MIDFLAFVLWVLGGSIVVAIAVMILAAVALQIRKDYLINERRFRNE